MLITWLLYIGGGLLLLALAFSTLFGLPGNFLLVLFALGVGFYEHFVRFDWAFLTSLLGGWLLGEVVEFFSAAAGAKKANASRKAITFSYIGVFLGMIIGTAVLPIIGTLAGSLLGGFLGGYWAEYANTGSPAQARQVALYVVFGQLLGLAFKLAIGFTLAVAILYRLPL